MPKSFDSWKESQTDNIGYVFIESEVFCTIKKPRVVDYINASYIPSEVRGVLNDWIDKGSAKLSKVSDDDVEKTGYLKTVQEALDVCEKLMPCLMIRPVELKKKENIRLLTVLDRIRFVQDVCGFVELPAAEFPESDDTVGTDEGFDVSNSSNGEQVLLPT